MKILTPPLSILLGWLLYDGRGEGREGLTGAEEKSLRVPLIDLPISRPLIGQYHSFPRSYWLKMSTPAPLVTSVGDRSRSKPERS